MVRRVGRIMSVGAAEFKAVRTAIMEAGKICKEVAFSTNNIAEAYSAFSVRSKRLAALIPYGVAAPEIPNRLTEKFIQAASRASLSSVFKSRFAMGFNKRETPRATPLSSHTFIKPNQTAYVAMRETQKVAPFDAPSNIVDKNASGEWNNKRVVATIKMTVNKIFITHYMRGLSAISLFFIFRCFISDRFIKCKKTI